MIYVSFICIYLRVYAVRKGFEVGRGGRYGLLPVFGFGVSVKAVG